jgi:hypothetical protein
MLEDFMRLHDSESHRRYDDEFSEWIVSVVRWDTWGFISVASKNPAFWKAIRTKPRL